MPGDPSAHDSPYSRPTRLWTVVNADRIFVLSNGSIVESGTHHELLAQAGLYRDLHEKQFASPQPARDSASASCAPESHRNDPETNPTSPESNPD